AVCHLGFSSRRRHTRSKRDWSSDVCSSDLILNFLGISVPALQASGGLLLLLVAMELLTGKAEEPSASGKVNVALVPLGTPLLARSEERRVGKERRRRNCRDQKQR